MIFEIPTPRVEGAPALRWSQDSYCIVCDASPDECDHGGWRYLDQIVYTRVEGEGAKSRWSAMEAERWRRDNPYSSWPKGEPSKHRDVMPLDELLRTASRRVFLDERLHDDLVEYYRTSPEGATLLVAKLEESAADGRLRSPGGWLAKRLKDLAARVGHD